MYIKKHVRKLENKRKFENSSNFPNSDLISIETECDNIAYMHVRISDIWVHLTVYEDIRENIKL